MTWSLELWTRNQSLTYSWSILITATSAVVRYHTKKRWFPLKFSVLVFTSQNFFIRGKNGITISRNCSELVLFQNKSEQLGLQNIGRQLFTGSPQFLQDTFKFINTQLAFDRLKYIWVYKRTCPFREYIKRGHFFQIDANMSSNLPHSLSIRTRVFPNTDGKIEPIFFLR